MSHHEAHSTDRRTFLQAGALTTAAALSSISSAVLRSNRRSRWIFPGAYWARPACN